MNYPLRELVARLSTVSALCLLAIAPNARADIIFDNGAPNQHNGNEMTDFLQSEDFTLTAPALLATVTFWDLQLSPSDYRGSLYWAIQQNAAGTPGAIIASGTTAAVAHTATGLQDTNGLGFSEFINTFSIDQTSLATGTYWLTLHDGPIANTNFADFYWEWSNDNGDGQEFDQIANTGWDSNLAEHAFQLGTVPEPGSIILLATVLGGLGLRMFRSSRKR